MTERERLLQQVQMHDFALLDAGMFLNGSPQSAEALQYFKEQQAAYRQAEQAYEARFGPLRMKTGNYEAEWTWVNDPWPWEGADN